MLRLLPHREGSVEVAFGVYGIVLIWASEAISAALGVAGALIGVAVRSVVAI